MVRLVHGLSDDVARDACHRLDRWIEAARQVRDIGEAEKWLSIHVPCGQVPPACPYCKYYSLRIAQESGRMACIDGTCKGSEGNRPRGRIDRNRITGHAMLVWADGRTIYYEGAS